VQTQWERVKAAFQEAFERGPSEQPAILDAACAGDAELRAAVERLLWAHVGAAGPLDSPPAIEVDPEDVPGRGSAARDRWGK
jgi:hypothetical protein